MGPKMEVETARSNLSHHSTALFGEGSAIRSILHRRAKYLLKKIVFNL